MKQIFRRILLIVFSFLLILAISMATLLNIHHKSYLVELAIAILFSLITVWIAKKEISIHTTENRKELCKLLILTVLYLLLNGGWVLTFHPIQAADYQTFWNAALDLSNGVVPRAVDYLAMFPHILGYAAFLSIFLKAFGHSILVASILNVLLTCATGLMIYRIVKNALNSKAAMWAFFLWTVCPSKMLYNAMVLSEPYYTCLILVFILIVSEIEAKESECRWQKTAVLGVVGGLVLGLVNTARPIGIIPIIAVVLWLIFLKDGMPTNKKWIAFASTMIISYLITGMIWTGFAEKVLGQKPPAIPGYSIYVGFNFETDGSYQDEDMTWFQSRYFGEFDNDANATQKAMLISAENRIQEGKGQITKLMIRKLKTLLGNDEGGAFYSMESLPPWGYRLLCVISNTWYYAICIMALICCGILWRKNFAGSLFLVILCSTGIILAQLLVEVAGRYHYSLIPLMTVLAAIGIWKLAYRLNMAGCEASSETGHSNG